MNLGKSLCDSPELHVVARPRDASFLSNNYGVVGRGDFVDDLAAIEGFRQVRRDVYSNLIMEHEPVNFFLHKEREDGLVARVQGL